MDNFVKLVQTSASDQHSSAPTGGANISAKLGKFYSIDFCPLSNERAFSMLLCRQQFKCERDIKPKNIV